MTKCQEIMTPDPECCVAKSTVEEIAKLMKSKNIGPVPIVESEDSLVIVGIVTDRDLVLNVLAVGGNPKSMKASEVMTPNPVTCDREEDIEDALKLMEKHQVRRIPITDTTGKLVGIIAQADIVLRLHNAKKTEEVLKSVSKPIAV